MTSTAAVHTMLLGFAGRIPDQLLTDLRFHLVTDDRLTIAYAIVAVARRDAISLYPDELTLLTDIFTEHRENPAVLDDLPINTMAPSFRFAPVANAQSASLSGGIDLTGDWTTTRDSADVLVDQVDATVMNAIHRSGTRRPGWTGSVSPWRPMASNSCGAIGRAPDRLP